MSRGLVRNATIDNGTVNKLSSRAIVRKINESFRIIVEKMKAFTRLSLRSPSPQVAVTNGEC